MDELYKYIISAIIGVPIGILGSFIAWWIIFHLNVANIQFSTDICKDTSEADNSGFRYRIKLENYGKRAILDLELIAKYRVKGLRKNRPSNWEIVYIPLHLDRLLKVIPRRKHHMRYVVKLCINELDDFSKVIYPEEIIEKSKLKSILLEDLLNLGTKRTLQIYGFGFDEFTGIRKLFESKIYSLSNIKVGSFNKKGLDVIPEKEIQEIENNSED